MTSAVSASYMWSLIKISSEIDGLVKDEFEICDRDSGDELKRLQEIDHQKRELFRQKVNEEASKHSWGVCQTVLQYVSSSSALVFGFTILSTAAVAGWILIAAGSLCLLNRAMADTGAWRWAVSHFVSSRDRQLKIVDQIDCICVYSSLILSIIGTIGAYHAGALALMAHGGRDAGWKKAVQILHLASGALTAVTRLGMAHSDRKILHDRADLKEMDAQSMSLRLKIRKKIDDLVDINKLSEEIEAAIKQALASSPI